MPMKRIILVVMLITTSSYAESTESEYRRAYAVGVSYIASHKSSGMEGFRQDSPELFGYSYYDIDSVFTIRPGFRVAYTFSQEPANQTVKTVSIKENDLKLYAETSLLIKGGSVIPVFTVGGGVIHRSLSTTTSGLLSVHPKAIQQVNPILGFVSFQSGVIIPINRGQFELSPLVRYSYVFFDSRLNWGFGMEASIRL